MRNLKDKLKLGTKCFSAKYGKCEVSAIYDEKCGYERNIVVGLLEYAKTDEDGNPIEYPLKEFTNEGKANIDDKYPTLFLSVDDMFSYYRKVPLIEGLKKLKPQSFKEGEANYYLIYNTNKNTIIYAYNFKYIVPLTLYFDGEQIKDFTESIKEFSYTYEEFSECMKEVFGRCLEMQK